MMDRFLFAEVYKLRRARVPGATLAVAVAIVGMVGLFFWIADHPETAESLGLLGQKARLALGDQSLDFPAFLTMITEVSGLGGLFLSAVAATFVFGREYAEGTAKVVLTLPVPRAVPVVAKVMVASAWSLLLCLVMVVAGGVGGVGLGLEGASWSCWGDFVLPTLILGVRVVACLPLVALVAVATRGYFAPLGFAVGTLVLASVFGRTGWAPWVPWSIIGLASGAAGPDAVLNWTSDAVLAATFLLGTSVTAWIEARRDNRQ